MTTARKRILLRGAYNLYNFGDDIILISWLEFLAGVPKYNDNDVELYITKGHESIAGLKFDSGFQLKPFELLDISESFNARFESFHLPWKIPSVRNLIKGVKRGNILYVYILLSLGMASALDVIIYKLSGKSIFIKSHLDFFKNLDVIHYIGGGYFAGWWPEMLLYEFFTVLLARTINPGIRIIGTGLGLGPFKHGIYKSIFSVLAGNFSYISVREECSMKVLEDLKTKADREMLGDDAILLLPRLKELKNRHNPDTGKYIALNLKDFRGYDYSPLKKNMQDYIGLMTSRGVKVEYFCFGKIPGPDDLKLTKIFDEEYRKGLTIHDPFEEGWIEFLENLSGAEAGIGFAYHFNVISALLKIPVVGIYCGDYYRQKIKSGIEWLTGRFPALSMDEAASRDLAEIIDTAKAAIAEDSRLESIYEKMSAEYTKLYKRYVS